MIRSGGPSPWSSHRSQYVLSRYISGYLNEEEKNLLSSLTSTVSAALEGQATAFFTSEICELHRIPSHPESHRRTQVIRERILALFPKIKKKTTIRPITKDKIGLFHTKKQINEMFHLFHQVQEHEIQKKTSSSQNDMIMYHIDEDTAVMKDTEKAALVAAGAVIDAVDLIMSQQPNFTADVVPIRNAFCGVRPPGHHAEPHRSMGFCYFNNVGIGACHVLQKYPEEIKKVLILDFDVHHGNGTQAKFEVDHPMVHFISTHQAPFYPHTGGAHERGTHNNILNVPIPAGTDSKVYRQLFTKYITPSMEAFQPDFIFVSAGFDAHKMDPLAEIKLESEDYYWITQQVTQIAWKYAKGRIVSVLEGGKEILYVFRKRIHLCSTMIHTVLLSM
jgi:acetoin utilization deacetylase AcuC-like enzyme